eukprot:jgi/Pico_ML_1/51049/g2151.t1
MYNVVLDHVIKYDAPAIRLVIWEEHLPVFARRMTSAMEAYATLVSHYRETVEWDFGKWARYGHL